MTHFCSKSNYEANNHGRDPEKDKVPKMPRKLVEDTRDAYSVMLGETDVFETNIVHHVRVKLTTTQVTSKERLKDTGKNGIRHKKDSSYCKILHEQLAQVDLEV